MKTQLFYLISILPLGGAGLLADIEEKRETPQIVEKQSPNLSPNREHPHSIGMAGSSSSGAGLSYKYAFEIIHMRFTGIYTASRKEGTTTASYNIGGELQYSVFQQTSLRGYLGIGSSYWGKTSSARNWHMGLHFGLEAIALRRLSFHFEAGYAHFQNLDDSSFDQDASGAIGAAFLL